MTTGCGKALLHWGSSCRGALQNSSRSKLMSTSFTDKLCQLGRYPLLALLAAVLLAGCTSTPSQLTRPEASVSRYAEQRAGGVVTDSDAIHVPPVPHAPAAAIMAEAALQDYALA